MTTTIFIEMIGAFFIALVLLVILTAVVSIIFLRGGK